MCVRERKRWSRQRIPDASSAHVLRGEEEEEDDDVEEEDEEALNRNVVGRVEEIKVHRGGGREREKERKKSASTLSAREHIET